MKIGDILTVDSINPDLRSKTKIQALEEMVNFLLQKEKEIDKDEVLKVILEREKLGSTGIGEGIAIPHGRLKKIDHLVASFGRSIEGIDFQSMDGRPTHLFFLLIAPEDSAGTHLKILARISRLLRDNAFRKKLMEASSREEIFQMIVSEDEKH